MYAIRTFVRINNVDMDGYCGRELHPAPEHIGREGVVVGSLTPTVEELASMLTCEACIGSGSIRAGGVVAPCERCSGMGVEQPDPETLAELRDDMTCYRVALIGAEFSPEAAPEVFDFMGFELEEAK